MNPSGGDVNSNGDWCHVSETVNMLYLAVCQIEATMSDANSSVNTLTQSFTHLANHTCDASESAQTINAVSQLDGFKRELTKTTTELRENISQAVQAFQFYDRVCQRIDHVARSLEKVSALLEDEANLHRPDSWKQVQDKIKSSYTMEAERIMFEFIMRGGSVKEALEIYRHHFTRDSYDKNDADEIELF